MLFYICKIPQSYHYIYLWHVTFVGKAQQGYWRSNPLHSEKVLLTSGILKENDSKIQIEQEKNSLILSIAYLSPPQSTVIAYDPCSFFLLESCHRAAGLLSPYRVSKAKVSSPPLTSLGPWGRTTMLSSAVPTQEAGIWPAVSLSLSLLLISTGHTWQLSSLGLDEQFPPSVYFLAGEKCTQLFLEG